MFLWNSCDWRKKRGRENEGEEKREEEKKGEEKDDTPIAGNFPFQLYSYKNVNSNSKLQDSPWKNQ